MIEILLAWAALFGLIYIYSEHNKTVKDYNELLDDYDLLQEENTKLRSELSKNKNASQKLDEIRYILEDN